jgi:hypothetical protein
LVGGRVGVAARDNDLGAVRAPADRDRPAKSGGIAARRGWVEQHLARRPAVGGALCEQHAARPDRRGDAIDEPHHPRLDGSDREEVAAPLYLAELDPRAEVGFLERRPLERWHEVEGPVHAVGLKVGIGVRLRHPAAAEPFEHLVGVVGAFVVVARREDGFAERDELFGKRGGIAEGDRHGRAEDGVGRDYELAEQDKSLRVAEDKRSLLSRPTDEGRDRGKRRLRDDGRAVRESLVGHRRPLRGPDARPDGEVGVGRCARCGQVLRAPAARFGRELEIGREVLVEEDGRPAHDSELLHAVAGEGLVEAHEEAVHQHLLRIDHSRCAGDVESAEEIVSLRRVHRDDGRSDGGARRREEEAGCRNEVEGCARK